MKLRIGSGLLILNLLVIVLIVIIILYPSSVFRIILGLPLLLFAPGYALTLALFPKSDGLDNIERIALGFGLSIGSVPVLTLILNYMPIGISLESTLYSVTAFVFIVSAVAAFRLVRLPRDERFSIKFDLKMPGRYSGVLDKLLLAVLVLAILGAIGVLGYVVSSPKVGERYTEFSILGTGGKAEDYPDKLSLGDDGKLIAVIANHEQGITIYRIVILIDGNMNNEIGPITLENDGRWEEIIIFTPSAPGNDQKVEFMLYREGQAGIYRSLHIWIDVGA